MDQCSIYQMNDDISYPTQTTPSVASHMLAGSHHYKHDLSQQPSTHSHQQGLRFQLQSQNQQIQNSNYHILSRHYLGQHHQQYHYQIHQHAGRQHVNVASSIPLNASKLGRLNRRQVLHIFKASNF